MIPVTSTWRLTIPPQLPPFRGATASSPLLHSPRGSRHSFVRKSTVAHRQRAQSAWVEGHVGMATSREGPCSFWQRGLQSLLPRDPVVPSFGRWDWAGCQEDPNTFLRRYDWIPRDCRSHRSNCSSQYTVHLRDKERWRPPVATPDFWCPEISRPHGLQWFQRFDGTIPKRLF